MVAAAEAAEHGAEVAAGFVERGRVQALRLFREAFGEVVAEIRLRDCEQPIGLWHGVSSSLTCPFSIAHEGS